MRDSLRPLTLIVTALVMAILVRADRRTPALPHPAGRDLLIEQPPAGAKGRAVAILLGLVALAAIGWVGDTAYNLATEARQQKQWAMSVTGGTPANAPALIVRFGCGSCHTIPNVTGADGKVGPALTQLGKQTFIAGMLPNTADNLVRWIIDPQAIAPGNAMPRTGISEQQARDVAAYLYSL